MRHMPTTEFRLHAGAVTESLRMDDDVITLTVHSRPVAVLASPQRWDRLRALHEANEQGRCGSCFVASPCATLAELSVADR